MYLKKNFNIVLSIKFIFLYFFILESRVFGATQAATGAYAQSAIEVTEYYSDGLSTITFNAITANTNLGSDNTLLSITETAGVDTQWTIKGGNTLNLTGINIKTGDLGIHLEETGTQFKIGSSWVTGAGNTDIHVGAGTVVEVYKFNPSAADGIYSWILDGTSAGTGSLVSSGTSIFENTIGENFSLANIDIGLSETATFNQNVSATTINSQGSSVFKGDLTGTNIVVKGDTTFNNTNVSTITGNINEYSSGNTTNLIIKNSANDEAPSTANFIGDIKIDTITLGETNTAGDAKFTGSVVADVINITGGEHASEDSSSEFTGSVAGTINLISAGAGTSGINLSGTANSIISSSINGSGTVIVGSSGITTFLGSLGETTQLEKINVTENNTSKFMSTIDVATLKIEGNATLNSANNTINSFELADGAVLMIGSGFADGQTIMTTSTQNDDAISRTSKIYLPSGFADGQTLKMIDSNFGDGVAADLNAVMQDNILIDYRASGTEDIITITSSNQTSKSIADSLNINLNQSLSVVNALKSAGLAKDTAVIDLISNSVNSFENYTTLDTKNFAKQSAPQDHLTSATTTATKEVTSKLQGLISNRMASLRSGDAGVSAGDYLSANSFFLESFGSQTRQANTKKKSLEVDGYDAKTLGVAFGFDTITNGGSILGLSFSTSSSNVDGRGTGKSKNEIDSYSASIYADKTGEKAYIESSLTYGINDNNNSRNVDVSGTNRFYAGNYSSSQISLKIGAGIPVTTRNGTVVAPFASFTGTQIETEEYTETSIVTNDSLILNIAQDGISSMVGTIGLKAHNHTFLGTPMISFAFNNEFGDTKINSVNTYQGGGTSFKTSTEIKPLSTTLGLGYSLGTGRTSIKLGYELEANYDGYKSEYGNLKITSKF